MKLVFSTAAEVAHMWANQTQESARCRNASFRGTRFSSYSTCIATTNKSEAGEELILISSRDYSRATSKHKRYVYRSASHRLILEVDDVSVGDGIGHNLNWGGFLRQYKAAMGKSVLARQRKDSWLAIANQTVKNMETYSKFFNLDWIMPRSVGDVEALEAAYKAAEEAAEKKRVEDRKVEEAEQLSLWLAGGARQHYFTEMRLRIKGDEIQTSQGANIPVDHALKLWPFVLKAHESGEAFQPSEHRTIHLGHYKFNGFSDDVLTVGCHKIPFSEIERMAEQLGLLETA